MGNDGHTVSQVRSVARDTCIEFAGIATNVDLSAGLASHRRAVGSEESGRVAAVCVPIEPGSLERSPDPGEAVTVSTGGPSWWSGPGEETAFNAARDPGSDNGQRTEAALLSLLNGIPGAVGSFR